LKSEIPNITGSFCASKDNCYFKPESGAFSGTGHEYSRPSTGGLYNTGYAEFNFNASYSSDRYGSYTEVNPLYNSCLFIIHY
jgi:hypothetical protein